MDIWIYKMDIYEMSIYHIGHVQFVDRDGTARDTGPFDPTNHITQLTQQPIGENIP